MQKTKVSLICKYKGVLNGKRTLQGVFSVGNNGVQIFFYLSVFLSILNYLQINFSK